MFSWSLHCLQQNIFPQNSLWKDQMSSCDRESWSLERCVEYSGKFMGTGRSCCAGPTSSHHVRLWSGGVLGLTGAWRSLNASPLELGCSLDFFFFVQPRLRVLLSCRVSVNSRCGFTLKHMINFALCSGVLEKKREEKKSPIRAKMIGLEVLLSDERYWSLRAPRQRQRQRALTATRGRSGSSCPWISWDRAETNWPL